MALGFLTRYRISARPLQPLCESATLHNYGSAEIHGSKRLFHRIVGDINAINTYDIQTGLLQMRDIVLFMNGTALP